MPPRVNQAMGRARGFMQGFTPGQRTVVLVVGLALVLGAFAVSRWLSQPSYALLFGNLSGTDASAVTQSLQGSGVSYQLGSGGTSVLVPQDQVNDLRVQLSGEGLPSGEGGAGGWSILDKQGVTATDFQQNVAYQRALEGELSKTLMAMDGVNNAVVHLAIPQKDVFADEDQRPTASVLLGLQPGTEMTNDQVESITHLVGGSVPDLDPTKVTVSDQTGKMLSGSGSGGSGGASAANATDQQTAAFENRMDDAVQKVLDTVVGAGHSVVRTNAQLDFNAQESTSESYSQPTPTPAPLSEATVKEQYSGGAAGSANGGTLGQIIPTPATGNGAANGSGGYSREQSTVNNSVDKTVSKTTSSPGSVKRLTVAVVLDAKTAGSIDPNRVQQLVANAVGLDPTRGDSVQVDTLPFDTQAAAAAKAEIAAADKSAKTAEYLDLAKKVGLGLLILIIAFLLLRRGKGRAEDAQIDATATDLPPGVLMASTPMALAQGEQLALGAGEPTRDKMRDDVAALVDNQPEDVAQMLQGWLAERK